MKVPPSRQSLDGNNNHYNPYPSPHEFAQPHIPHQHHQHENGQDSTSGDAQPQYKVARAISSCTRCRQRKQKCDGKLPACSACERAKVECIGFDAISKTNVSRNHLHSLEQEVASLKAQLAAFQSGQPAESMYAPPPPPRTLPSPRPSVAQSLLSIRSDIPIDPSLTGDNDQSLRSPWDSSPMRSEYNFPPITSFTDSPRGSGSPFLPPPSRALSLSQLAGTHPVSLTRMVHDAALRTGHALNNHSSLNPTASIAGSNSDRGSVVADSPSHQGQGIDPRDITNFDPQMFTNSGPFGNQPSKGGLSASPATLTSSMSSSKPKRNFAVPPLPPQPAVERLVAAYVDFVGVTAPIIHIPTLGKQLIKVRAGNDVEQSDIFIVMMMLALSTMASARFVDPPDELRACSEAFHAEAMKHLDAVFEEQSYVGLQAILLLVWYSLLNPEKGSIWFLVGLATRTCVDLGLHNEANRPDQLDALELDMRRRLFWTTYKMDRLLSQALGRPPSIPDGFINVPLPSVLHDVDIHPNHFGELSGDSCSYKAIFIHTTKLRQLQSEILTHTYGVHGVEKTQPEWFDECYERLKDWMTNAPDPRGTVSTEGYAISFHNSALLLYRPSPGNPRPGRQALETVLASSSYIVRIYRRMQTNNRISWLWMTSHFTFMAGLSFLYAFFNLYSLGVPGVPTVDEAMVDIDSCMAVLEYLTPRVPSAGACHDTMRAVSKAIFDRIHKLDPPTQEATPSASSPGRQMLRGAPISSSRNEPLPNEAFPAPLPAIPLPYELSLLDNLFVNPMMAHTKASDYTNGCKTRAANNSKSMANDVRFAYTNPGTSNSFGVPQGTQNGTSSACPPLNLTLNHLAPGSTNGLGPYGMAAQVSAPNTSTQSMQTIDPTLAMFSASSTVNADALGVTPLASQPGELGNSKINGDITLSSSAQGDDASGTAGNFDIFSFLMDEDSAWGGNQNWDNVEMPADYPLWS